MSSFTLTEWKPKEFNGSFLCTSDRRACNSPALRSQMQEDAFPTLQQLGQFAPRFPTSKYIGKNPKRSTKSSCRLFSFMLLEVQINDFQKNQQDPWGRELGLTSRNTLHLPDAGAAGVHRLSCLHGGVTCSGNQCLQLN